jgi:hypothetical protein
MAQILVLTDAPDGSAEMVFSEHVESIHLESDHCSHQLLERVTWAVRDAQQAERRTRATMRRPAVPSRLEPERQPGRAGAV